MSTAFREMILETVFVAEGVEAVCTDIGLAMRLRPATYETRKTFDYGVVKLVSIGQQQQTYVMKTFV